MTVKDSFNITNHVIRTRVGTKKIVYGEEEYVEFLKDSELGITQGSDIQEELNRHFEERPRLTPFFQVVFIKSDSAKQIQKEPKTFGEITSQQAANNEERRIIGELATEMTMLSYGYSPYNSQNTKNQGVDGIFIDSSTEPELFLTEARCRGNQCSGRVRAGADVATMFKECCSEEEILAKIEAIPDDDTKQEVKDFISETPEKVFRFAHRILPTGKCHCRIEPYPRGTSSTSYSADTVKCKVELAGGESLSFNSEMECMVGMFRRLSTDDRAEAIQLLAKEMEIKSEANATHDDESEVDSSIEDLEREIADIRRRSLPPRPSGELGEQYDQIHEKELVKIKLLEKKLKKIRKQLMDK